MHKYIKHGKGRTDILDLAAWLKDHELFTNAGDTFRGLTPVMVPRGWGEFGQLPEDWKRTLTARFDVIAYFVYSYRTPIAWFDKDANSWIMPEHTYSTTTTRHQAAIRYAISTLGMELRSE